MDTAAFAILVADWLHRARFSLISAEWRWMKSLYFAEARTVADWG
jgi:hypothetical protein